MNQLKKIRKNIKVVFVDLDETLVSVHDRFSVSEKNQEILKQLQSKGIYIVITTGRSREEVTEIWEKIYLNKYGDFAIYNNGAAVEDLKNKIIIAEKLIDPIDFKKALDFVRREKGLFRVSGAKTLFVNELKNPSAKTLNKRLKFAEKIYKDIDNETHTLHKIDMFFGFDRKYNLEKMQQLVSLMPETKFTSSNNDLVVEMTANSVTKAYGAKKLLEHLKIDPIHTLAIGDSMNDYELMQFVHFPVVMINGNEKLKDIAKYITTEVENDGVYHALNEIFKRNKLFKK